MMLEASGAQVVQAEIYLFDPTTKEPGLHGRALHFSLSSARRAWFDEGFRRGSHQPGSHPQESRIRIGQV